MIFTDLVGKKLEDIDIQRDGKDPAFDAVVLKMGKKAYKLSGNGAANLEDILGDVVGVLDAEVIRATEETEQTDYVITRFTLGTIYGEVTFRFASKTRGAAGQKATFTEV